ncbi:MAG TPA: HD domain-containing protein, partial [Thermodesulfobacteriota bacterium]|nr:HD domain-containing protein [Thermodesulfobacteriota bacterium]
MKISEEDRETIARLFPALLKIRDEGIRDKVVLAWIDGLRKSNYRRIEDVHQFEPARDRISYTNVDHTNQVCLMCEKMAEAMEEILGTKLNRDHLLAGAILHDVDKMALFDSGTGTVKEPGRKLEHTVLGAALALEKGLPEEVAHMIRSHSTAYSPERPRTTEALILHYADLAVGKGVYLAKGLDMETVLKESMA